MIIVLSVRTKIHSTILAWNLKLLNGTKSLPFLKFTIKYRAIRKRIPLVLIDLAHAVLSQVSNYALATFRHNLLVLQSKLLNHCILTANRNVTRAFIRVMSIIESRGTTRAWHPWGMPSLTGLWVNHLNFFNDTRHDRGLFCISPPSILKSLSHSFLATPHSPFKLLLHGTVTILSHLKFIDGSHLSTFQLPEQVSSLIKLMCVFSSIFSRLLFHLFEKCRVPGVFLSIDNTLYFLLSNIFSLL